VYVSAKLAGSTFDFPDGSGIEIYRPDSLEMASVEALEGGGSGPEARYAAGTVQLAQTAGDTPRAGQKVSVTFTNRLGDKYAAFYLLKPEDIGESVQATLTKLADGLATVLASSASEDGRPFSEDYEVFANSTSPGSLTIQALSNDIDFETDGSGGLAVSRLVPLSVTVSGPLRVVAPED